MNKFDLFQSLDSSKALTEVRSFYDEIDGLENQTYFMKKNHD
jgi:hypothetical protein